MHTSLMSDIIGIAADSNFIKKDMLAYKKVIIELEMQW